MISVIGFIIPLAIVGAIIYLIVRPRYGNSKKFNAYHALMWYFYLVTAASVLTIATGIIYFLKVAFNQMYNNPGEIDSDLTVAVTLLCTGLLICILHVIGRRALQKPEDDGTVAAIRRRYLFLMLSICSLTGLVALPLAIYRTVFYYFEDSSRTSLNPFLNVQNAPSEELAVVIPFIILWVYYVFRVVREVRQKGGGEAGTESIPSTEE